MSSKTSRCKCITKDGGKCRKKLTLMDMECRCGKKFCALHRLPEEHNCTFDYKTEGKKLLKQKNPVVESIKVIPV